MPSKGLGLFRGFYVPVGLLALIAVGVHGAADVLDDQVLRGVERLDAWLDSLWAMQTYTEGWVAKVDSLERTWVARAVAFIWEVAVDLVAAVPCLNYFEEDRTGIGRSQWRPLLQRLNQKPTLMRVLRPVFAGIFAATGAWVISRSVESALYERLHAFTAVREWAPQAANAVALVAFALVLGSLAWRCVGFALIHADAASERQPGIFRAGLVGTLLALPLALAAVADALPRLGLGG
jgi:hypothetical protein